MNIQAPKFPSFAAQPAPALTGKPAGSNLDLVMKVPLSVSVEIGKTKKKIREIMESNRAPLIELEKQAGAPVDIVVNGAVDRTRRRGGGGR
jgi:flagellar motor switch protein FliN/FliY